MNAATPTPVRIRRRVLWPAMALPVVFLIFAVPVILSGNIAGTGAYDQLLFHQVVIRWFTRDWPNFDFSNYPSATTPGYHLILALDTKPGMERKFEDIREVVKEVYADRMREAVVTRQRQTAKIEMAPK